MKECSVVSLDYSAKILSILLTLPQILPPSLASTMLTALATSSHMWASQGRHKSMNMLQFCDDNQKKNALSIINSVPSDLNSQLYTFDTVYSISFHRRNTEMTFLFKFTKKWLHNLCFKIKMWYSTMCNQEQDFMPCELILISECSYINIGFSLVLINSLFRLKLKFLYIKEF
jgi:hypothetical protein